MFELERDEGVENEGDEEGEGDEEITVGGTDERDEPTGDGAIVVGGDRSTPLTAQRNLPLGFGSGGNGSFESSCYGTKTATILRLFNRVSSPLVGRPT